MKVSGIESSASGHESVAGAESGHPWGIRCAIAVGWTLTIMIVCWIPRVLLHEVEGDGTFYRLPNFDKLVHGWIFVVFAVAWLRALSGPRRMVVVFWAGLLLAIMTEAVQEVPVIGRDATLGDIVADSVGVLVGLAITPLIAPWLDRWERRVRAVFFGTS
jgi:hypothetical protein